MEQFQKLQSYKRTQVKCKTTTCYSLLLRLLLFEDIMKIICNCFSVEKQWQMYYVFSSLNKTEIGKSKLTNSNRFLSQNSARNCTRTFHDLLLIVVDFFKFFDDSPGPESLVHLKWNCILML